MKRNLFLKTVLLAVLINSLVACTAFQPAERPGLGLVIVKSIVKHHSGQVQVESEENKGSCFTGKHFRSRLGVSA